MALSSGPLDITQIAKIRNNARESDMRYVKAFVYTAAALLTFGLPLYFYFAETLIAIICIISVTLIGSIIWAFGKHELSEIIDPIRKRYKMSMIASKTQNFYENIEEAAADANQDLDFAKRNFNRDISLFRKSKFMESLPDWIIRQAFPFLAVSAPKWIIAVIIGVLVIRFHEDIIPHKNEEQNQSVPNEIMLQVKISGDIQKGEDMLDSTININDYCIRAHSGSNVIVLSNDGCN